MLAMHIGRLDDVATGAPPLPRVASALRLVRRLRNSAGRPCRALSVGIAVSVSGCNAVEPQYAAELADAQRRCEQQQLFEVVEPETWRLALDAQDSGDPVAKARYPALIGEEKWEPLPGTKYTFRGTASVTIDGKPVAILRNLVIRPPDSSYFNDFNCLLSKPSRERSLLLGW